MFTAASFVVVCVLTALWVRWWRRWCRNRRLAVLRRIAQTNGGCVTGKGLGGDYVLLANMEDAGLIFSAKLADGRHAYYMAAGGRALLDAADVGTL